MLADTRREGAARIAETIRAAVAGLELSGDGVPPRALTVSLRVASAEAGDPGELESLVERADQALYRAKGEGRNRICVAGA